MESRQDVLRLVRREMAQINASYNADGVGCLPHRWQRAVDNLGDYLVNSEVRHPRCVGSVTKNFCVLHLQSNTTVKLCSTVSVIHKNSLLLGECSEFVRVLSAARFVPYLLRTPQYRHKAVTQKACVPFASYQWLMYVAATNINTYQKRTYPF